MIHVEMIWVECLDRRKMYNRVSFFSVSGTTHWLSLYHLLPSHCLPSELSMLSNGVFSPTALRIAYVILCVSHTDFSVRHADTLSPSLSPSVLIRDI